MKSTIIINTYFLNQDDIRIINQNASDNDIEFQLLETNGFAPSELILILIDIAQNVGYNAIYDILKYCLLSLTSVISEKTIIAGVPRTTKIKISINKNKFALSCNFPLSKSQQDELIAAAMQKLKEMDVST